MRDGLLGFDSRRAIVLRIASCGTSSKESGAKYCLMMASDRVGLRQWRGRGGRGAAARVAPAASARHSTSASTMRPCGPLPANAREIEPVLGSPCAAPSGEAKTARGLLRPLALRTGARHSAEARRWRRRGCRRWRAPATPGGEAAGSGRRRRASSRLRPLRRSAR